MSPLGWIGPCVIGRLHGEVQIADVLAPHTAVARFAALLRLPSVAVVNDSLAYGQSVAAAFAALARGEGIAVDGTAAVSPVPSGYRTAVRPILARSPAAIYIGVSSLPAGIALCRAIRSQDYTGVLLGDTLLLSSHFISGCGSRIGRVYVGSQIPPYDATPQLRAFSAAYQRAFGTPPQGFAIYGYEQMSFLLAAIDAAQSTDHAAVVNALHRITLDTALGRLHVNARGNLLNAPMYVYAVTRTTFSLVGGGKG